MAKIGSLSCSKYATKAKNSLMSSRHQFQGIDNVWQIEPTKRNAWPFLAGQPGRDSMVGKSNTSGEEEEEVPARSKEELTTMGLRIKHSFFMTCAYILWFPQRFFDHNQDFQESASFFREGPKFFQERTCLFYSQVFFKKAPSFLQKRKVFQEIVKYFNKTQTFKKQKVF
jgi:hypothetical protein